MLLKEVMMSLNNCFQSTDESLPLFGYPTLIFNDSNGKISLITSLEPGQSSWSVITENIIKKK